MRQFMSTYVHTRESVLVDLTAKTFARIPQSESLKFKNLNAL